MISTLVLKMLSYMDKPYSYHVKLNDMDSIAYFNFF